MGKGSERRTRGGEDGLMQAVAPEGKRGHLARQDLGSLDLATVGASVRSETRSVQAPSALGAQSHSLVLIIPLNQDLPIQLHTSIDSLALAVAPHGTRRSVDTRLQEVPCASRAEGDVDFSSEREAGVREGLDSGLGAKDEDDVVDLCSGEELDASSAMGGRALTSTPARKPKPTVWRRIPEGADHAFRVGRDQFCRPSSSSRLTTIVQPREDDSTAS